MKLSKLLICTFNFTFISLYDKDGFLLYSGNVFDFAEYARLYKKDWNIDLFDKNITHFFPIGDMNKCELVIFIDYRINFMKGE